MCERGIEAVQVRLCAPTESGRTEVPVDPCIAPLVQALNDGGMQTLASCCGHGKWPGSVVLGDGSELVVGSTPEEAESYRRWCKAQRILDERVPNTEDE